MTTGTRIKIHDVELVGLPWQRWPADALELLGTFAELNLLDGLVAARRFVGMVLEPESAARWDDDLRPKLTPQELHDVVQALLGNIGGRSQRRHRAREQRRHHRRG